MTYMAAMTGFYQWLGRVIMLVLAGMITLSIIGAIAAIPSGSIPSEAGIDPRDWSRPEVRQTPAPTVSPAVRPASRAPQSARVASTQRRVIASAPAPRKPPDPAQWLEAITYALFALAGLAAFATLLLWRALHQWRRSADALEALSHERR
jgi:hypothetical protein